MYRALKSVQVDMNEMLLKFADEVTQVAASHGESKNSDSVNLGPLEITLVNMMNQQNAHFNHITTSLQHLNNTMMNILNLMNNQKNSSVNMADKIPSIQPSSSNTDLKDICIGADISKIEHEEDLDADIQPEDVDDTFDNDEPLEENADDEVAEEEVAEEEVAEEEVAEEQEEEVVEEQEEVVEDQEEVVEEQEEVVEEQEEEQEEELEVEEWSYKGRLFFKDGENTVYLNDGGELGDPVGIYDPVKNIVKKLPSN